MDNHNQFLTGLLDNCLPLDESLSHTTVKSTTLKGRSYRVMPREHLPGARCPLQVPAPCPWTHGPSWSLQLILSPSPPRGPMSPCVCSSCFPGREPLPPYFPWQTHPSTATPVGVPPGSRLGAGPHECVLVFFFLQVSISLPTDFDKISVLCLSPSLSANLGG